MQNYSTRHCLDSELHSQDLSKYKRLDAPRISDTVTICAETDEGIAHSIVRSVYSFEREPWPRISEDAKDLVSHMLDPDPYTRLTAGEVLGMINRLLNRFPQEEASIDFPVLEQNSTDLSIFLQFLFIFFLEANPG